MKKWRFQPRGYLHFDVPVDQKFADKLSPKVVSRHTWSPLLSFVKKEKRYKPVKNKTEVKERQIMYASHRDACILSKYSHKIVTLLEDFYSKSGLDGHVIAYRPIGKANYDFANTVREYILAYPDVQVMCFDVTGFFDNLDHKIIKSRLKWLLDADELPDDWFAVFKFLTKFRHIPLEDIKLHPSLAERIKKRKHPLVTIKNASKIGLSPTKNPNNFGIPQGTPISASVSNLYLVEFDLRMKSICQKRGALYQRYSDDIIVVCAPADRQFFTDEVERLLAESALKLQREKTESVKLSGIGALTFQYLGYRMGQTEARIREKSLSRQWRKLRRRLRYIERIGGKAVEDGKAKSVYTRDLNRRFALGKGRNFLNYADRSATALDSPAIRRQTKRLRKFAAREIERLKGR